MDTALLARSHADGLSVFDIAYGVGLGVFEGDEREHQVPFGRLRQGLVLRDDILQQRGADLKVVPALLKGDAEDVFVLDGLGDVGGVDLNHIVAALALGAQDLQGLVGVAGRDDAVGDLQGQIAGGLLVTDI